MIQYKERMKDKGLADRKGANISSRASRLLKRLALLLAISLLSAGMVPVPAHRVENNDLSGVTIQVELLAQVEIETTFMVGVAIAGVENLNAASFEILFDPSLLEVIDIYGGEVGGQELTVIWDLVEDEPGRILVIQDLPVITVANGSGYLAHLLVRAGGTQAEGTRIALAGGVLSDASAQPIIAAWLPGETSIVSSTPETDDNPPAYLSDVMSVDNTKIFLDLDESIFSNFENDEDGVALREAVVFTKDGESFGPLGEGDTVTIDGSALVVTFANALVSPTNKIKVAANTLKDEVGNVLDEEIITEALNADDCFIATPAFGSMLHPQVQELRDFRDDVQLKTAWGKRFVSFYYENSPPIAAFIAQNEYRRVAVRLILAPVILVVDNAKPTALIAAMIVCLMISRERNRLINQVGR